MTDTNSTKPKYRIAYMLKPLPGDGLTKGEMQAHPEYAGWGGTDRCVIASILDFPDGGSSTQLFSRQQDGRSLPEDEIYKIVTFLCRKLAINGELSEDKEALCWAFFNANVQAMGHTPQDLDEVRKLLADE